MVCEARGDHRQAAETIVRPSRSSAPTLTTTIRSSKPSSRSSSIGSTYPAPIRRPDEPRPGHALLTLGEGGGAAPITYRDQFAGESPSLCALRLNCAPGWHCRSARSAPAGAADRHRTTRADHHRPHRFAPRLDRRPGYPRRPRRARERSRTAPRARPPRRQQPQPRSSTSTRPRSPPGPPTSPPQPPPLWPPRWARCSRRRLRPQGAPDRGARFKYFHSYRFHQGVSKYG